MLGSSPMFFFFSLVDLDSSAVIAGMKSYQIVLVKAVRESAGLYLRISGDHFQAYWVRDRR
jgi:hypothetical protein